MSGQQGNGGRGRLSRRGFLGYASVGAAAVAGTAIGGQRASAAPLEVEFTPSGFGTTVAAENTLPGTPKNDWETWMETDSIAGFTTEYSYSPGQTVNFKILTNSPDYRVRIFRLGWYQGHGARHLADVTPSVQLPQQQPAPVVDAPTGLVDCGNWAVSATWTIPADALSGVYYAKFGRLDENTSSHTIFVVRRQGPSDILVQTSEMTMHAYNRYGGNSLYYGEPAGRAYKVSYNRPFIKSELESDFFNAEVSLVRWLERNGYEAAYCGGIDVHQDASILQGRKVFISSGHDEYVSGPQRDHVTAARDAGVHLIFMSGNEYFWRIRMEPSIDGSGTPDRTIVCYKETLDGAKTDPLPEWTGTWRDPRFSPPSNGGRPENELTGTLFRAILPTSAPDHTIQVPAEYAGHRIWRNTPVAGLTQGQSHALSPNTLGYEFDVDAENGHRPPGLIRLSTTEAPVPDLLVDYGKTYVAGTATHHITMYRAPSGALVWGLGTVQWAYGLDEYHICDVGTPTSATQQQATLNVLADMGVQPVTRQPELVAATASTDTIPPTVTIASPLPASLVPIGSPVIVSGTAVDSGGGVVAGVEVSVDGGDWQVATGKETWSHNFVPLSTGSVEVRVRAIDDSSNIGIPAQVTVEGAPRSFPCSIFAEGSVPETRSVDDPGAIEAGVRFRSGIDGFITGLRFFKGTGNTGTHVGRLWTNGGVELASATFAEETGSGWQTVAIPGVAVAAGTTYVASVFMPLGHYSADAGFFNSAYELAPLTAPANGDGGGSNGVYRYGSQGFPTQSFGASNYWVDVVFDTDNQTNPLVIDHSPGSGLQSVAPGTPLSATFNEQVDPATITVMLAGPDGTEVPGSVGYDSGTRTATFTSTTDLGPLTEYSATISGAVDTHGNTMEPFTWVFTTIGPPGTSPTSLWDTSAAPAATSADPSPVELGMKFRASTDGSVTAFRFHKAPGSNGTHLGHLWSATGELLATATFTSETSSGWQQVQLGTPVELTADTTYVVSYFAPNGVYGFTSGMFNGADVVRGPLRAPNGSSVGGNGVFAFGSGGFPVNSWGDTNYWVDVVFEAAPDLGPPSVVSTEPAADLISVALNAPVKATFNEPISSASLNFTLSGPGGVVPASVSYDATTATATLTPSGPLAPATEYTAAVSASDMNANAMTGPYTWSFTSMTSNGASPVTLWDTSAVPAVAAVPESSPVEVGVRVLPSRSGQILGLRFFKGVGNEGPHIGRLWSATGNLLATTTFTSETQSGWQQSLFAEPVPIQGAVAYVASYHAPAGHYSVTGGGLNSSRVNGPLTAPATTGQAGNGLFAYGAGGFPNNTWGGSNYWVDVIFADDAGPSVTERSPDQGATVAPEATVRAVFDEQVTAQSIVFTLRDSTGTVVGATVAYDDSDLSAVLTPTSSLTAGATYTASVEAATDNDGNALTRTETWSFSVIGQNFVSLWNETTVPGTTTVSDTSAVNLGLKFRSTVTGTIQGVRFYKGGPGNSGPHTGALWAADGTLLASIQFSGETARGWQVALFQTPVEITTNTVYVVSYHAPHGQYSADGGFFSGSGHTSGPLEALQDGVSGGNGLYHYNGAVAFPQSSYNGANYWVDVLFLAQ